MNKSRCVRIVVLIALLVLFIVSAGFTYNTYAYSFDQSTLPEELSFTIMLFLILANVALDFFPKLQHASALHILVNLALIVVTIINLIYSDRDNFHIIFNSIIVALASMDFTIHLVQASLKRVREKVEFVPTRPIIKP